MMLTVMGALLYRGLTMRGALIIVLFVLAATLGPARWRAETRVTSLFAIAEEISKQKHNFKECDRCPEMVMIPAGPFVMGSPNDRKNPADNEGPQHRVPFAPPLPGGRVVLK